MKKPATLFICLYSFLFAYFSLISPYVLAQKQGQQRIDSIISELRKAHDDTTRVNQLNALSWTSLMMRNSAQSKKYADQAWHLARSINFEKGEAQALNNIGIYYQSKYDYSNSLKYYQYSLNIFKKAGYKKGIGFALQSIGAIYSVLENIPKSREYFMLALDIYEQLHDWQGKAYIYSNLGFLDTKTRDNQQALSHYKAALKINKECGKPGGCALNYCSLGSIYSGLGQYEEALRQFDSALAIAKPTQRIAVIATCDIGKAKVYFLQKNYAASRSKLTESLHLLEKTENEESFRDAYEILYKLDSVAKQPAEALAHYQQYIHYRDVLINEDNVRNTIQLQLQFDYNNRENMLKAEQQKKTERQRIISYSITGVLLVTLIFLIFVFYQRNKISREKKKSDALLLNILPAEVATELKATGSARAKSFTQVTVMFTDFKDFTRISELISAELLVAEIHYCFSAFDRIIQKYKIEKIKTIGDAYLCVGGLPVSNPAHAEDIVSAAIEICQFIAERKKEKLSRGEVPFEIRIGINTGSVVAGIVGVKKYAYDIWGDTVNLAARMEQNSEVGKINISGSTYERVKDKFHCEYRGKIEAKNKGMVDMYFVETV